MKTKLTKLGYQLTLFCLLFSGISVAQTIKDIEKVEPAFWWTGMQDETLQLLVYGNNIAQTKPELAEEIDGIQLVNFHSVENPNYLFIDLTIGKKEGNASFDIEFKEGNNIQATYTYNLLAREENAAQKQGFNSSDVIYLITPDRYANGNVDNDEVDGYLEGLNRTDKGGRHGGDLQGVIDNLDYIAEMGYTAIWLNPVLENNMESYSYHGYAITDFYKVDGRYGDNEQYRLLSELAAQKGIKLVADMVMNHCGSLHWWMKDLPSKDWFNYQAEALSGNHQITTHRRTNVQDPYSAKVDYKEFADGWFVPTMPDMNQNNPFLAKYLIQNSIWWIEYANLGGVRMDTYSYPDKDFMSKWTCALMDEYPNMNIVGEEWSLNPAIVAHWQKGKENPNGYASCLPSLMDFPLQNALVTGLNNEESNFDGMVHIYESLANDFLFADPSNLVVFPDNHDMDRFYTQVNEDFGLYKLGIAQLLTTRGIPQLYYGTEILMTNDVPHDHGIIRTDFPGGWEADPVNAFTGDGLTAEQKEAQQFMKQLLNWRKNNEAVQIGDLKHFVPREGVYVYFRYTNDQKVMIALNKNKEEVTLDLSRFNEILPDKTTGTNIFTNEKLQLGKKLNLPAYSPTILEIVEEDI